LLIRYLIWAYVLHLISDYFFLLAYTLVLYLWGKTFGQNAQVSDRACRAIAAINFVCTLLAVAALGSLSPLPIPSSSSPGDSANVENYGEKYGLINITLLVVYSLSFVVLTSGMIWYGISLLRQLQTSVLLFRPSATLQPSSPSSSLTTKLTGVVTGGGVGGFADQSRQDTRKRIAIIFRVNLVLMGCNLCFALRVWALFTFAIYTILGKEERFPLGLAGWFLLSNWIPTIIPVSAVPPPPSSFSLASHLMTVLCRAASCSTS
jgi:hypothetical protein